LGLDQDIEDLVREFVGSLRPWLVRDKAGEAAAGESLLSLVESGAGEAELGGALANRGPLPAHPAQHLVLDLDEISGIEEVTGAKQRVFDPLGVPVQAAALVQGLLASTRLFTPSGSRPEHKGEAGP